MDIRILTLLVFVCVTGSLAEFRDPYYRVRRRLQESDKADTRFIEPLRAKRATSSSETSSTDASTITPKDTTTASAPSTSPTDTPAKKPSSAAKPNPSKARPTARATPKPDSPSTVKPIDPTDTDTTEKSTTEPTSTTSKPGDTKPTTPSLGLDSRIDPDEESPKGSGKKPQQTATGPTNKGLPPNSGSGFPSIYASPYFPYDDPSFNSIPGPRNYAWTGTSGGPGMAASFAGASASSFGGAPNVLPNQQPSLTDRGAFVDNSPNQANLPNAGYTPNTDYSPNTGYTSNTGYWPNTGYSPNTGYAPNTGYPSNTGYAGSSASSGGFGGFGAFGGNAFPDPSSFAFPGFSPDNFQKQMEDYFRQLQSQFQRQQQALFDNANRIGSDGYSGPGPHSAISSISLGPQGGYQAGAINPVAPGVQSRFGEEIPPPSGGTYGVFSSSSSKTATGPDGKTVSHKISTTGVNDNGKITFRTVES